MSTQMPYRCDSHSLCVATLVMDNIIDSSCIRNVDPEMTLGSSEGLDVTVVPVFECHVTLCLVLKLTSVQHLVTAGPLSAFLFAWLVFPEIESTFGYPSGLSDSTDSFAVWTLDGSLVPGSLFRTFYCAIAVSTLVAIQAQICPNFTFDLLFSIKHVYTERGRLSLQDPYLPSRSQSPLQPMISYPLGNSA